MHNIDAVGAIYSIRLCKIDTLFYCDSIAIKQGNSSFIEHHKVYYN